MKSSTLFDMDYVHLMSTRRHSRDRCSQAFFIFLYSSASVYYTERKPKNKKQGRPGNEANHGALTCMSGIKHLFINKPPFHKLHHFHPSQH